ncbi:MAG: hypothetical protein HYR55_20265 [Acidobacteria bacterium]|nr:hypothetical protein [Acidobacteriota bacterium]
MPAESVPQLAVLYDRFANALDPFAPERDQAEMLFEQEVARLYDALPPPKPNVHTLKKGIILRCRRHLRATDKPPSP